ncbi:LexA family protein [Aneurinibacillus aneurinilyticus]|uniref:LexA family protein n=1 Tax=Aneurinibacillus aneurinilyticus TaxID=1391 RepID=UPI0023F53F73|nr:S24 family peptidase [Aneurinibacillus aneurinilyticus]
MKISSRQKEIIEFIKCYQADKGYSPSTREIAKGVGLASSSTVHGHLERLERRGYIKRGDIRSPRAIEIIEEQKNSGAFFAKEHDQVLYFLVEDDAMAKSKIKKGDTVIVRPTANVEDGSIALVNLGGRKMIRRLYSGGRQRMLEADEMETIVTSEANVIGKVIGVIGFLEDGTESI